MSIIKQEIKGNFSLNYDRMKVPTDNSMYDCLDCIVAKKNHEIKDDNLIIEADYPRYGRESYWVRKCTGCGKMDGPWSHYGDY